MGKVFYTHFDLTPEQSHPAIRVPVWSLTTAVLMSKGSQAEYWAPGCFRCSLCVWVHFCWSVLLLAGKSMPPVFIWECVLIGELPSCGRKKCLWNGNTITQIFIPQVTTVRALALLFLLRYSRQCLSNPFQPAFCLTSMSLAVVGTISGVKHSGYCSLSDSRDSSQQTDRRLILKAIHRPNYYGITLAQKRTLLVVKLFGPDTRPWGVPKVGFVVVLVFPRVFLALCVWLVEFDWFIWFSKNTATAKLNVSSLRK